MEMSSLMWDKYWRKTLMRILNFSGNHQGCYHIGNVLFYVWSIFGIGYDENYVFCRWSSRMDSDWDVLFYTPEICAIDCPKMIYFSVDHQECYHIANVLHHVRSIFPIKYDENYLVCRWSWRMEPYRTVLFTWDRYLQ